MLVWEWLCELVGVLWNGFLSVVEFLCLFDWVGCFGDLFVFGGFGVWVFDVEFDLGEFLLCEWEVFELICCGVVNKIIVCELDLSFYIVKCYVVNILIKLGVVSCGEVVVWWNV